MTNLTQAMQEHRAPSLIRGHRRAKPPVHKVVANMSVERGALLAVLNNSEAVTGYPIAIRVFRVNDNGHEIHIDTILAQNEIQGREELARKHGLYAYANLTTEQARMWKEVYRLGAPQEMIDLPRLLMETFCAIRDHQVGQLSEAECNATADCLRTALGMPRWGTEDDFPSLPTPFGVNTPYGPVYGQPEAIAYLRELIKDDTNE